MVYGTSYPAPLMLGLILGPMLEDNLRRALLLSRGSFEIFVTRPISATLMVVIALFVLWQAVAFFRQARKASKAPMHETAELAAEH